MAWESVFFVHISNDFNGSTILSCLFFLLRNKCRVFWGAADLFRKMYLTRSRFTFFPVHIDGGYTTWTAWSTCSVSCGSSDAVHTRSRSCTNPRPLNNGLNCTQQALGGTVEVQPCGRGRCPGIKCLLSLAFVFALFFNFEKVFLIFF